MHVPCMYLHVYVCMYTLRIIFVDEILLYINTCIITIKVHKKGFYISIFSRMIPATPQWKEFCLLAENPDVCTVLPSLSALLRQCHKQVWDTVAKLLALS